MNPIDGPRRNGAERLPIALRCATLAVALLLAGPAAADDAPTWSSVEIPVVAVADARVPSRPLAGRLALPSGAGPFPAIVVLHGCGGAGQHEHDWAVRLAGWGYAALLPDSFGARRVGDVCRATGSVTSRDRAADVIAAALYLRTLAQIDANAIGVIGFSHGGGAAAAVTREEFAGRYPGLIKAAVAFYGGCGNPEVPRVVPILTLTGSADDWVSAQSCIDFRDHVRSTQPVEVVTYPGVAHGFDDPSKHSDYLGHRLSYDAAAASDSIARTRGFLDRWVRAAAK